MSGASSGSGAAPTARSPPITLAGGLGRVADVQAADFDGDGDLDLVVAEFGWLETGAILLLENRTTDAEPTVFVPSTVDPRHGAIHVPVADLNGDGRPDFVALISQEHETVVAFLNAGGAGSVPRSSTPRPTPPSAPAASSLSTSMATATSMS